MTRVYLCEHDIEDLKDYYPYLENKLEIHQVADCKYSQNHEDNLGNDGYVPPADQIVRVFVYTHTSNWKLNGHEVTSFYYNTRKDEYELYDNRSRVIATLSGKVSRHDELYLIGGEELYNELGRVFGDAPTESKEE